MRKEETLHLLRLENCEYTNFDFFTATRTQISRTSVLLLLPLLAVSSLFFGLTASIFFANSVTFGLESKWLNCSSSEPSLIIIPFFLVVAVAEPEV
jgi:hypothetical protein